MSNINLAIIGSWGFHATEFVLNNRKVSGCNMVAAWDKDPVSGRKWAESLDLRFEEDYQCILDDPTIDGVIITSETRDHAEKTIQAARAGKAVFVEKAPMLSAEEALRVKNAVDESGILYVFSDPILKGEAKYLKQMADEGLFGQITMMHVRYAHAKGLDGSLPDHFYNLEEAGGGVTLDVGCHGIHMLQWFLGPAKRCNAIYGFVTNKSKKSGVEDNSAVTYLFDNGAIGISQSSWAAGGKQGGLDIYGTKGCARMFGGTIHYCLEDGIWKTVPKEDIPIDSPKPMDMWLDSLINGNVYTHYHVDEAVTLTNMIEAAIEASADLGFILRGAL